MNENSHLKYLSLFKNKSFFENSELGFTSVLDKVYNIYGFEMLHILHLSIPMPLKECTFKFLVSLRLMTKPGSVNEHRKPLSQMRLSILRSVSPLLVAIEQDTGVTVLRVDFSNNDCSIQLNGVFQTSCFRKSFETKDYQAVNIVSPIVGANIDHATRFQYELNMTGVHHNCFKLVSTVVS